MHNSDLLFTGLEWDTQPELAIFTINIWWQVGDMECAVRPMESRTPGAGIDLAHFARVHWKLFSNLSSSNFSSAAQQFCNFSSLSYQCSNFSSWSLQVSSLTSVQWYLSSQPVECWNWTENKSHVKLFLLLQWQQPMCCNYCSNSCLLPATVSKVFHQSKNNTNPSC